MQKTKNKKAKRNDFEKVANIIRDAGGQIVGRTRLQKVSYLLELAGFGEGFSFSYHRYGPYSEELNLAAQIGSMLSIVNEEERSATWGGKYSVYSVTRPEDEVSTPSRKAFAKFASSADSVELELAATAAFLATEGVQDPWGETSRRKPEKISGGRLDKSKALYLKLLQLQSPKKLPDIL